MVKEPNVMIYRRNGYRSVYWWVYLSFWLILGVVVTIESVISQHLDGVLIGGLILVTIGVPIVMGQAKITLNEKGIGFKSIFRSYFIRWEEIRSTGAYSFTGRVIWTINTTKLDRPTFFPKMIYVSRKPQMKFYSRDSFGRSYISFEYRKEAWQFIESKLQSKQIPPV